MDIYYELFDHASATLLKEYDSEIAAWDDLRAFLDIHGIASLEGLALLRVTDSVPKLVAMDADLIALVQRHPKPAESTWSSRVQKRAEAAPERPLHVKTA
ncbi:MAG: hypothetical protein QM692_12060 [Thermomicrobiales bacterium]